MAQAQIEFKAKDAIEAAFAVFREFFSDGTGNVSVKKFLLEGIEYMEADQLWMVTIGFDYERRKPNRSIVDNDLFNTIARGQLPETEIIRETRRIFLDANDGHFIRMDA